ncbi:MAG: hypothetical protein SOU95_00840 [Candidatus Cryptobacteroides sp.]|nr:hypothetical protein [Bacteroidales bacterium]MDD7133059.1 hypothetical protein [Bacteroidales bacterium]MDY2773054.1 hypothetical protein [Candidatus Cryptobacteroides sp.]
MAKRVYGHIDGVWQISDEDRALFDRIAKESVSENEKHFFRVVEYREKHNQSMSGDVLLNYAKNPDGIGIMRYDYDMYMFLIDIGNGRVEEPWTASTLDSFLDIDLTKYIYERTGCRTMFEYLRSTDYEGIDYEADND